MKHEARAFLDKAKKPGAVAAAVLALSGVGVKPASAHSDGARAAESALSHETQGAAAFLKGVQLRMNTLAAKMLAAPGKHTVVDKGPAPTIYKGYKTYEFVTPGSQPHTYNLLVGELSKNKHNPPIELILFIDANSKNAYQVRTYQDYVQLLPQHTGNRLTEIDLLVSGGSGSSQASYSVNTRRASETPSIVDYSHDPGQVADRYDTFFRVAGDILKQSS